MLSTIFNLGHSISIDHDVQKAIDTFIKDAIPYAYNVKYNEIESLDKVLALPDEKVGQIIVYTYNLAAKISQNESYVSYTLEACNYLIKRYAGKKVILDDDYLVVLLEKKAKHHFIPSKSILRLVERKYQDKVLPKKITSALKSFKKLHQNFYTDEKDVIARIELLLHGHQPQERKIKKVDLWTATYLENIEAQKPEIQNHFNALLDMSNASSAKPSKKWMKDSSVILEKIGQARYVDFMLKILGSIGGKADFEIRDTSYYGQVYTLDPRTIVTEYNHYLRSLIWACGSIDDKALTAALGEAAQMCFKKIPGHGPLSPKIGNASLFSLSSIATEDAIYEITRLSTLVKHPSTKKQIEKTLEHLSEKTGLSQDELNERSIPDYGFSPDRTLTKQIGERTTILTLSGVEKVTQTWLKENNKSQKTTPKEIKEQYPDELKALRTLIKSIKETTKSVKSLLERHYAKPRRLELDIWKQYYYQHPLVWSVAKPLIWCFEKKDGSRVEGIERDEGFVDVDGKPIALKEVTHVSLWHPIESSTETVREWRQFILQNAIRQPFKQAHREVYVLTDAEIATETYSNRFASHILKQHQFNALLSQRGWHYTLQGEWDSYNTPYLETTVGYRVEFWVEPIIDKAYVNEMGIYLYLTTDQVKFYSNEEGEYVNLSEVPKKVFSEVLRDIDLFVSICSIGSDPNWVDSGPEAHGMMNDYWSSFSFGELSESAKTRRELLEDLIPMLAIADQCSLSDRFLVVKGKLRTYKIHIGSSNIQMEPDNQYLCIVQDRSMGLKGDKVMLPFEDDNMLSLILSKAFLLANDDKIKDKTILSQIRSR
ncbi:DUF4132 domain-containing protein [Sulfurovum mangrovi]|uniref:DUF4132 domain-containing protein n=1 Tax=Sulfurovum mangrovi TaxID=2893889 RepID=UPI001E573FBC|nr:DUF4132 domain-containing protein [Sulfurovum mangrovi]UFH60293.1 DUF4132 domain-containing protein [Sulfurovum mangrovi]